MNKITRHRRKQEPFDDLDEAALDRLLDALEKTHPRRLTRLAQRRWWNKTDTITILKAYNLDITKVNPHLLPTLYKTDPTELIEFFLTDPNNLLNTHPGESEYRLFYIEETGQEPWDKVCIHDLEVFLTHKARSTKHGNLSLSHDLEKI